MVVYCIYSIIEHKNFLNHVGYVGYAESDTFSHQGHIGQQENRGECEMRNASGLNIQRLYHKLTNDMDYPSPAVCYD